MTIAGPIVTNACATVPSGPGRRTNSTAPNVVLQKSIAAEASRHTNIGITTGTPSGIGFTLFIIACLDVCIMRALNLRVNGTAHHRTVSGPVDDEISALTQAGHCLSACSNER